MNRDIHNIIAREYERRQKLAADIVEQRKDELYEKIPELRQIENQINQLGIKYNRLILLGNGDKSAFLTELSGKLSELAAAKNELLIQHNISPVFFSAPIPV
ncbi:MAG TPA: hypothetical protein VHP38_03805 [Ruminiclostridium sp.]|nr:hypothetical protein [Ruminiclostridium sp.]